MDEVRCARLGEVPYAQARALQKRLEAARQAGAVPDVLLLLEHPPVYTKGRRSQPAELGMGEEWYRMQGIEIAETDRGGAVTYHGPGQLVGYPVVSLRSYGDDVRGYVAKLERLMISALGEAGVEAQVIEGLTGVWTAGRRPCAEHDPEAARKIGSIGVHVSRGVTTHGFAVNVNNDLQPFEWIVPCGIEGVRMTSVCRELGMPFDMGAFCDVVERRFGELFARRPVGASREELLSMAGGTAAVP